jgi:hypothetical protein
MLKKDEDLRLCVDYYSLNKITIKNRYMLFLIGKFINRLFDAAIYIKLNIEIFIIKYEFVLAINKRLRFVRGTDIINI